MTFQYPWQKKVFFIALIAALLGLLSESMAFFDFDSAKSNFGIFLNIKFSLSTLNLDFFNNRLLMYHNFETGLFANYLNLIFYFLLLGGALWFAWGRQKETRLIRFVFSIILLCNVFFLLNIFVSLVLYYDQILKTESVNLLFILIGIIRDVVWIYLSYWLLKKNADSKSFEKYQRVVTETYSVTEYPHATLWQRFFHVIMDTYICVFIFSSYSHYLMNPLFIEIEHEYGERALMYTLVFVFRLLYYPIYETILDATPAKFLTETRVLKTDGSKASFKTVLGRTLSRFVPFESLSFFGGEGWHDRWSDTQVVQEKRTGIYGGKYFLIFPILIVSGLLLWWGYEKYDAYKAYTYHRDKHNQEILLLEEKLNKLSDKDFIEIDVVDSYESSANYLKVEKVNSEYVRCTVIHLDNSSLLGVEQHYTQFRKHLPKVDIKRSDLLSAFTREYEDYNKGSRKGVDLLQNGKKYEIKSIVKLFGPVLRENGGSIGGENIYLRFCNDGWPANLIKIENIEGNIQWQDSLPMRIETVRGYDYPQVILSGANYEKGTPYCFRLVMEDSLHHRRVYEIKGIDLKKTFKQLD